MTISYMQDVRQLEPSLNQVTNTMYLRLNKVVVCKSGKLLELITCASEITFSNQ